MKADWPECSKACSRRLSLALHLTFMAKDSAFRCWPEPRIFTYPISGLIAPDKKIREKREEIKRLIRAGIEANRYIKENREGTIQVLMGTYKLPREIAAASYESLLKGLNSDGSLPLDGFQTLLEDTKRLAKLDREVSLNDVADLSILREAQRDLGIGR